MSGYGYETEAYGYGYGSSYGGYAIYLGPAQFDLRDEANFHLDGPGSTFYAASAGRTEYLHEYDNGAIFGQQRISSGSYYAVQTSYAIDDGGSSYFFNNEYVRDAEGLPFDQFYNGQPVTATSGYFSEHGSTTNSGGYEQTAVIRDSVYSYADGSYHIVDTYRTYESDAGGHSLPQAGSYDRASSYVDAATGYTYAEHNGEPA